jgi:hypothetical protein
MAVKILRAGTPPRQKNRLTVATDVADSTTLDLTNYAWGSIKFEEAPGIVTVYARMDEDDEWAIAQDDATPPVDITFLVNPGKPCHIPAPAFFYSEIRFVGQTARTNVPVSLKT